MNERQAKKRERTGQLIVQAAKELIHENGFNRLSLRAIAARIGFAPASLYEYFTGKDDIIDTLCEEIDRAYAEKMNAMQTVPEMLLAYVEFGLTASDDFQLLYQRAMLPSYDEQIPTVLRARVASFEPELRVSVDEAVQILWSLVHGLVLLSLHREGDASRHASIVETVWMGLLQNEDAR